MEAPSPRIAAVMLDNMLGYVGLGNSEMPISILRTFLGVAIWGNDGSKFAEGRTIADLAKRMNLPEGTIYQHIRYLGTAPHRYGKPGLGLVETSVNPENRRQKFVRLTSSGQELMSRIAGVLSRNL